MDRMGSIAITGFGDGLRRAAPAASIRRSTGDPVAADGERTVVAVERPAFEVVYAQEYRALVRVAFLLLGTTESAEEVVQDVFVRAHLRWDRLDGAAGYLRTSVVNGCRDRLRRRGRLRARLPRLIDAPTAHDGSAGSDDALELHRALLELPLRQRTAIVGRYFCGWDDDTIAEVIGARPGTVRSLISRGLVALRLDLAT